jgi:SAM-dependent methyltransferase
MERQENAFFTREGNEWFKRNRDNLVRAPETDPVISVITMAGIIPIRVMEIGASTGWRLDLMRRIYGCKFTLAIEPSKEAIWEGQRLYPQVNFISKTASKMPNMRWRFDMIIFGFCLYLCDPETLFEIVARANRCLINGGHLIIHDFPAPVAPYSVIYEHHTRLRSYHMDFAKMFLAHPAYSIVAAASERGATAVLLKKSYETAFPLREKP